MADRVAVAGAAAGTGGASYRRILTYAAKVAGNYVLNETNFAGLGQYLPCLAVIALTPGAGGASLQVSYDNGTTWMTLVTGTAQCGGMVYLDTANTFRLVITTNATDVRIFVQ
jgi:hypothetical protein